MDLDDLTDRQLAELRYRLLDDRDAGRAIDQALLEAVEIEIIARWLWRRFWALRR